MKPQNIIEQILAVLGHEKPYIDGDDLKNDTAD